MQWIEGKRLEMVMDTAGNHAKQQIKHLRNKKNRKALQQEMGEWIQGEPDPDETLWMDHHHWW